MAIDIRQSITDPPAIDPGNVSINGRIISKTIQLGMFATNENAVWASNQQLRKVSYPYAPVRLTLNRKAFRYEVGDCFKWTYSPYPGISNMICRVLKKGEESLESEKIIIDAIEDCFSIAGDITIGPSSIPHTGPKPNYVVSPLVNQTIMEAPYALSGAEVRVLPVAGRESNKDLGFALHLKSEGGSSYAFIQNLSNLRPFGTLITAVYPATTYPIDNDLGFVIEFDNEDVDQIETTTFDEVLAATKNNALFGNEIDGYEIITFQTITPISGRQYRIENIIRGRFDTERQYHPVGDRFFFIGSEISTVLIPAQIVPIPNLCSLQYSSGVVRAEVAARGENCWSFDVPAGTSAILVQVIGTLLNTNAVLSWTFPDGRVFPGFWGPPEVYNDKLIGPGTASVNLHMRSQTFPAPNIDDQYVPEGRHTLRINGVFDGNMGIGF